MLELLKENSLSKETPVVKEEDNDDDDGGDKVSDLSNEDVARLATILDKTEGWKRLAEKIGLGILVPVLSKGTSSPSLTLLSYINVSMNTIFLSFKKTFFILF